jgi:alkyl sulfatase BDS1-like metallo-beta-lactamase superfamily hydrolase
MNSWKNITQYYTELAQHWAMRGYYGTLNHNVKATYVYYLGWFDDNPSTLHVLPPEEGSNLFGV